MPRLLTSPPLVRHLVGYSTLPQQVREMSFIVSVREEKRQSNTGKSHLFNGSNFTGQNTLFTIGHGTKDNAPRIPRK